VSSDGITLKKRLFEASSARAGSCSHWPANRGGGDFPFSCLSELETSGTRQALEAVEGFREGVFRHFFLPPAPGSFWPKKKASWPFSGSLCAVPPLARVLTSKGGVPSIKQSLRKVPRRAYPALARKERASLVLSF
jgi:hypothetical protein